ncbi:MAG: protein kinase [Kofleriaceae bacterium]
MGAAPDGSSVGRYELLIELAKGGMAELYLGRLHGVGGFAKLVAIKRILPHLAEDKLFAEMFLNEGRIAAQLAHANICQVHELGEADGDLFLAMEYLEGVTWSELVRLLPRDTTTLRLAAGVIAQACEGLHFAHELRDLDGNATPVVHRDVSPQNLFVTTDGTCKVLDFGIAKMLKDGPRTRTGVLKGKLPYMSPEQIQGEEVDARSDVFALGVVLWESLTGKALFDRETDFLIWKAITEAPIPPLAPFGFPTSIDAVISSALARDKKLRFRSARALGEALRNAVEPIGGAFDAGEIADVVRLHCGAKLVERQREIASAVTRRSKPTLDEPNAADTIEDKAGSTTDLAPVRTNAGSTVRLRSDAKAVARAEPEPDATLPPTRKRDAAPRESSVAPAPSRSKAPWIIAGGLVLAGVIVAIAMTRGSSAPVPSPAPVATTDVDSVEGGLKYAQEALEAVGPDGRLGRAMESLDSIAKWGQKMGAVRDSIHGSGLAADEPPVDPEADEPVADEPAGEDKPAITSPERTTAPASKRAPKPDASTAAASKRDAAKPAIAGDGFLSIDSQPFAIIFLDGKRLGETPFFNLKVPAGTHELRAVLEDGRSQKKTVVVEVDTTTNLGKLTW